MAKTSSIFEGWGFTPPSPPRSRWSLNGLQFQVQSETTSRARFKICMSLLIILLLYKLCCYFRVCCYCCMDDPKTLFPPGILNFCHPPTFHFSRTGCVRSKLQSKSIAPLEALSVSRSIDNCCVDTEWCVLVLVRLFAPSSLNATGQLVRFVLRDEALPFRVYQSGGENSQLEGKVDLQGRLDSFVFIFFCDNVS